MAFRLSLKPHERCVIASAVIRNGDSRAVLLIENEVPILRERFILSPAAVRTPADRLVMAIQLMYVDPARKDTLEVTYWDIAGQLRAIAPSLRADLDLVGEHVAAGRYYQALKAARSLRENERKLLDHVR